MKRFTKRLGFLTSVLMLQGCADDVPTETRVSQAVVLLTADWPGSWPVGLDPATNTTGRANVSQMNAIFGGLFQLVPDASGSFEVKGVLAAGYEIADEGRTVIIRLREGVQFSDGAPFDAAAVKFNVERNLSSSCPCAPTGWPWDETSPVTAPDAHTVVLHFARPFAAAINAIPASNLNWVASPTALAQLGEDRFKIAPVGAGPFKVVENQFSSRLVLERNPLYWDHGRPYLDRLTFQSIGNEQAGYQAVLAGDAQVYEAVTYTPVVEQARKRSDLVVTQQPATSTYVIQLNSARRPFDDKRAREAIYYATDVEAIRRGLFNDHYPATQSFTAPGGLFHTKHVPGYRTYDLQKARSIVHEMGGFQVKLGTIKSFVAEQITVALQSQWQQAGIDVSIQAYEVPVLINEFQTREWQAMLQTVGAYDPEAGPSVRLRFHSGQLYTGVQDAELDGLLDSAASAFDPAERTALYATAAQHISDNAYAPFLFGYAPAHVTVRGIEGPGLTSGIPPVVINTGILWDQVRLEAR